ncbi:HEAT repeat domain-containing protein [bacterium]|nr:HEAT repeat domain-containing protein [bacterium]
MGNTKRSLTFWVLVLGLCIGAIVLVPFFRANKANKSEAEGTQKEQTKNLSEFGDAAIRPTSKSGYKTLREKAAKTSSEFEDNSSIQPIAMKDKRIRQREIEALGKTGDSQSITLLISVLKDEDMDIRGVVDYIYTDVNYVHSEDMLLIEETLVKIGKPAVKPLIAVLKDRNNNYARARAIKILGKIGDSQAVKSLVALLKDKDWDIRWRVVKALGEIGDNSAIKPLVITLKDEDRRVRYRAVEALENMGDKQRIVELLASLKDEDFYVQLKVIEALKIIAGEDFGEWQKQELLEQNQWLMQKLVQRQFEQQKQKLLKEQTKLLRERQLLEQNKDRFSAQELLEQQKLLERSSQKLLEQEQWLEENKEKFSTQK